MDVYFIGGSPCSGKSTVAAALCERYDLACFKVDDHLDRYLKMGAAERRRCCAAVEKMTPEQIWMRDPHVQCEEELGIYEEIFDYIMADLEKMPLGRGIITEGAAYLPALARRHGIPASRYLSITPTKAFQVLHYSKREWVPYVLNGCSDQKRAFENWMERDALFAEAVRRQCIGAGYVSLINRGDMSAEEMIALAAAHFSLQ